ncbi:hypothetical protein [Alicyclobacillus sp. SO9]|uniref:hypothetical protein n=1 Tax=Alicyclobacillus sp. SO9 TaxID=2665646 RepID=UPI0018E76CF0|nr:hypothetical protein [Alicyclobacillus sp. SO9]QQE80235.1 hypothetical protein GI364_07350 [Alicyclobacillus sp. SO9]
MKSWIILGIVTVVLIAAYIVVFIWARRRQRTFDQQYNAAKERHDIFVLNKKMVRERPKTGMLRYMKVKTYQVIGRVNLSQTVKGIQMSRMQTVTFQTSKEQYQKIEPNHKYKVEIAGNYIGNVYAPPVQKKKTAKKDAAKGSAGKKDAQKGKVAKGGRGSKQDKSKKSRASK